MVQGRLNACTLGRYDYHTCGPQEVGHDFHEIKFKSRTQYNNSVQVILIQQVDLGFRGVYSSPWKTLAGTSLM